MQPIIFPGWGLEFIINPVALNLFGLEIHWYSVIIAFGFFLATMLSVRHAKAYDINPNDIFDLLLFAAPLAIIGARL